MAVINGTPGNDPLNGTSGNDTITGLGGDDTITGGAGNDTVDGGEGNDVYKVGLSDGFDVYKDTGTLGTDTIQATVDNAVIGLQSGFGPASGIEAISANGHAGVVIKGGTTNDTLNFTGITLTGITAIDGGSGSDTITGSAGVDTIIGGAANDILDGGQAGDTYLVGAGAGLDSFKDTGTTGTDTIRATADNAVIGILAGFSSVNGIEAISADGHAGVTIAGGTVANSLNFSTVALTGITAIDGGAGNDTITGSTIADTIIGGVGNDTLNGGEAGDTFLVGAGAGFDSYKDTGKAGTDSILASADNVVIGLQSGFAAASGIEAIGANGHAGVTISGGAGNDALDFSATTLTGIAEIGGGAGNDKLTGSTAGDMIAGGVGIDTLAGGAGKDTFLFNVGDTGATAGTRDLVTDFTVGTDQLDISKFGAFTFIGAAAFDGKAGELHTVYDAIHNITVVEGDVNGDKSADFGIELSGNLVLGTGDFTSASIVQALTLTGDNNANQLTGGAANETLLGLGGNDTLKGNGGTDTLEGGTGNDTLDGGEDGDTYRVGLSDGFDVYKDTGTTGTDTILATVDNAAIGLQSGFGAASGIEAISANGHAGVTIKGGTTNDTLSFTGVTLTGVTAIDGGSGSDTITGSAGLDTIIGGAANDILDGGEAGDTYLIGTGAGFDSFKDTGTAGTDTIRATADNAVIGILAGFNSTNGIEAISADGHAGVTIAGGTVANNLNFSTVTLTGVTAIDGGGGNDTITGSTIADTIIGGAGNDTLDGGEAGDTFLVGAGAGFDSYKDTGKTGTDSVLASADNVVIGLTAVSGIEAIGANGHAGVTISGGAGNDTLSFSGITLTGIAEIDGGAGNDKLTGSSAADAIAGGVGVDTLTGGGGKDTFVFNVGDTGAKAGTRDLVTDFTVGTDQLDTSKFGALNFIGAAAFDGKAGELHAVYDSAHNVTIVEGDLNGDKTADFGIELSGKLTLGAGDFTAGSIQTSTAVTWSGTENADTKSGMGSDDILSGLGGNDHLSGLAGNDILDGGNNDDTLDGGSNNDTLKGGDGTDNLTGGDGDDTLDGGTGSDTLIGGKGNDTYITDGFDFISEGSAEGVDTVISTHGIIALDNGVENAILAPGAGDLYAYGNSLNNVIIGNEGANEIRGMEGADTMTGGGGADTFEIGPGHTGVAIGSRDVITDFTQGTDKLDLGLVTAYQPVHWSPFFFVGTASFDGAKAELRTAYDAARDVTVVSGDVDGDKVADFAIELTGKIALTTDDFVSGSVQVPIVWTGSDGLDYKDGFDLNDTLIGLGGTDNLTGQGGDDYIDGGSGDDWVWGDAGNDMLIGGDGNDRLIGNDGNDTQLGGSGDDLLFDQAGDDVIDGGTGADQMGGGDGNDTYYVDNADDSVSEIISSVDSQGNTVLTPGTGIDTVITTVSYTLPDYVEILQLKAGAGSIGGAGNSGANTILGNESSNTITGGGGADILSGGNGADVFVFAAGDSGPAAGSRDLITDFKIGSDQIDISQIDADVNTAGQQSFKFIGAATFDGTAGEIRITYDSAHGVTVVEGDTNGDKAADFNIGLSGNLALTAADLAPVSQTGDGNANTLAGTVREDVISGLGGNDQITGGGGDDTIDGGPGDDTAVFSGKLADYQLVYSLGGTFVTDLNGADGDDGTDAVFNVEHLKFADRTIDLAPSPLTLGVATGDLAGFSVSGAGDVNKDGFADFIIGAAAADTNGTDSGAAYVVFGNAAGIPEGFQLSSLNGNNGFSLSGTAAGDHAGFSVASAGDVNGDGYADLIVGAAGADPHGDASGAAYIVFGKASGFAASIDLTTLNGTAGFKLSGAAAGEDAGTSVHAADLNRDGYSDLIVGAPGHGAVGGTYVVFGHSGGFVANLDLSTLDGANGTLLTTPNPFNRAGLEGGISVGSADFNGDGIADAIVGVPYSYGYGKSSGAAYVIFGHAGAFPASEGVGDALGTSSIRITGDRHLDLAGFSVASAGDMNGDGFDDIIVGTPYQQTPYNNDLTRGAAYVVFGTGDSIHNIDLSTLDGSNGFKVPSVRLGDYAGYSVSSAGDVNGDGFADLLIGAPNGGGANHYGIAYVVFGHAGGFDPSIDLLKLGATEGFWVYGDNAGDRAGESVSAAGDLNGDGYGDLLIGAPGSDYSGAVEVVYGSDLLGLDPVHGTSAANTLNGTANADTIIGVDGNDTLNGLGADDFLIGGNGNDTLNGADGSDQLVGGRGNDTLTGGGGNDALYGGAGNDTAVFAGASSDYSITLSGTNVVVTDLVPGKAGDEGTDTLTGIEWLKFSDKSIAADTVQASFNLSDLDGASGVRLYGTGSGDQTGYSLSSAGDVNGDGYADMLVGAFAAAADGLASAGKSYLVYGGPGLTSLDLADGVADGAIGLGALNGTTAFRFDGAGDSDRSGFSVSSAGDVNGDGLADLLIGARDADPDGAGTAGVGYVVYGGTSLTTLDLADGKADGAIDLSALTAATGFRLDGNAGDQTGWSVAGLGDINGDGYGDLALAARNGDASAQAVGSIYVVYGTPSSLSAADAADGKADAHIDIANIGLGGGALRIDGFAKQVGWAYGDVHVASASDVNGDGYDDLVIGSPYNGPGTTYLVFGGAANLAALDAADGKVDGHASIAALDGVRGFQIAAVVGAGGGRALASAGDVNGDGFDDIIVGGQFANNHGQNSEGAAYVIYGGMSGLSALDNADGTADGQIHLEHLSSSTGLVLQGFSGSDLTGFSVSSAGDVNGDGIADMLVGATGYKADGINGAGAAYVVFGGAENITVLDSADGTLNGKLDLHLLNGADGFRLDGTSAGEESGFSVSAAGDVNGDGFGDLMVGAPWATGAGAGYIVYGGDFTHSALHVGDAGANTLTGNASAESFVGGAGNDTLNGGGGADSFDVGIGNDEIHVADRTLLHVDGGGGADTLHLDFAGAIDFGNLDGNAATSDRGKIVGIETIDVTNGQNNAMTLHLADVLDLDVQDQNVGGKATLDNTLKIDGNAGDTLHLSTADGWSVADTATLAGYAVYTHQAVHVAVDTDIAVTVS